MKTSFQVSLESGEQFTCAEDEKVLIAMERAGVRGIPVGCRGGGCGACRVEVVSGKYDSLRMGKNHVSEEDAQKAFALSCRIFPRSDLVIKVMPKVLKAQEPRQDEGDKTQAVAVNT